MRPAIFFPVIIAAASTLFAPPAHTSIVINEIMNDPAMVPDHLGEWFELHNTGGDTVDINGWSIRDSGQDDHRISVEGGLQVPPDAYRVLGREGDPSINGGYLPDYVYSGFTLSNGEDEILLVDSAGVLVDSVTYGGAGWPGESGSSLEFIEGSPDNALGENWALATDPFGVGDRGTPGLRNSASGLGIGGSSLGGGRGGFPANGSLRIYPNPFSGTTTITFSGPGLSGGPGHQDLQESSRGYLRIFDLRGRRVRTLLDGDLHPGTTIVWDGRDDRGIPQPSGIYLLVLKTEVSMERRKIMLSGR